MPCGFDSNGCPKGTATCWNFQAIKRQLKNTYGCIPYAGACITEVTGKCCPVYTNCDNSLPNPPCASRGPGCGGNTEHGSNDNSTMRPGDNSVFTA
jgi:hypothetical protein